MFWKNGVRKEVRPSERGSESELEPERFLLYFLPHFSLLFVRRTNISKLYAHGTLSGSDGAFLTQPLF